MRGNLQTRLKKLEDKHCDALLLAYAGVHRMGYDQYIAQHINIEQFTPPVGQGSVAIECAKSLDSIKKTLVRNTLNHAATEQCVVAERAFLKTLQGGCSVPVFGYAQLKDDNICLTGGVVSLDGQQMIRQTASLNNPEILGETLATSIANAGGREILATIRLNQS
jgi:hydroxymethylbilane synthase